MKEQEIFNQVMQHIARFLNQRGYSQFAKPKVLAPAEYRPVTTFRKPHGNNYGVINFQKKSDCSGWFTINIGVSSAVLDKNTAELRKSLYGPSDPSVITTPLGTKKPSINDCDWKTRINRAHLYLQEWWPIMSDTSVEALIQAIQTCLEEEGIPKIENLLTDEQLKHYYLACRLSGEPHDIQTLERLSILLKASNETERLAPVLHRLETQFIGNPVNRTAQALLNMLRTKTPEEFQVPEKTELTKGKALQPQPIQKRRTETEEEPAPSKKPKPTPQSEAEPAETSSLRHKP